MMSEACAHDMIILTEPHFHLQISHSPMGSRCPSLHDPRVTGLNSSWLELCTKPRKASLFAIPDGLYHDRDVSRFQDNPIIDYHTWKSYPNKAGDDFSISYDLVCNLDVSVFGQQCFEHYGQIIDHVHKLAIVRAMEAEKTEAELNFIYSNKASVNGQPCLVLKTRYFRLQCLKAGTHIKIDDIVQNVSANEYNTKGDFVVQADEVVFESKGMPNCNRSIFFNAKFVRGGHVTKNEQDRAQLNRIAPTDTSHRLMQSKDGCKEGRKLIDGILKHRIAECLAFINCTNDYDTHIAALRNDFIRLQKSGERWLWPVHGNKHEIFSKINEERNATEYEPRFDDSSKYSLSSMWTNFAHEMHHESKGEGTKGRLDVFRSLSTKAKDNHEKLPHIKNSFTNNSAKNNSNSEKTWKELLLGDDDGAYKKAMRVSSKSGTVVKVRSSSDSS
jgi:hypothetical protein